MPNGIIKDYDYPEPQTTNWLEVLLPWVLTAVVLGLMWYFMFAGRREAWERTAWPSSVPPGPAL